MGCNFFSKVCNFLRQTNKKILCDRFIGFVAPYWVHNFFICLIRVDYINIETSAGQQNTCFSKVTYADQDEK